MVMSLDFNLCLGCGCCIDACASGALELTDSKAFLNEDDCNECKNCIEMCPVGAIELK